MLGCLLCFFLQLSNGSFDGTQGDKFDDNKVTYLLKESMFNIKKFLCILRNKYHVKKEVNACNANEFM
jgi:hypothetical protein